MTPRSRFQGVRTVVGFNWPLYVAALAVLGVCVALLLAPWVMAKVLGGLVAAGALWFLLGSLGASFWVYDRSDLYRWHWLRELMPRDEPAVLVCHTGFDEVSESLAHAFPHARIRVLDHFDPELMTEPSIRRARARYPPKPEDLAAAFDGWPELSADLILAPLSIHELRSEADRAAWFREARRSLTPDGWIVVVEHLRDAANFAAFGPGFVHFHSPASWRRCWKAAGCVLERSLRITPFVRIFVLK